MHGLQKARVVLEGITGVAGALVGAAALAEWLAERRDARAYPMPGRLVDVGGHRLHLWCMGTGTPSVVLDAGLAGSALDWGRVLGPIAAMTQVCAYDRAGYGWSDPGPEPRTSQQLARELHTLLQRAGIPAPYVLVGHSFAGYTLRVFAGMFPNEVAGMVLVDASAEGVFARLTPEQAQALLRLDQQVKRLLRVVSVLARFGLVRLAGRLGQRTVLAPFTRLPEPERTAAFALRYRPGFFRASAAEYQHFPASGEQARATGTLGDLPLVVLSATGSDALDGSSATVPAGASTTALLSALAHLGADLQGEMAAHLSTNSQHRITTQSGHHIALTQPDLVIEAVRTVVEAARTHLALHAARRDGPGGE